MGVVTFACVTNTAATQTESPAATEVAVSATAPEAVVQPNIIFILVDDLGKEWISAYGADDIQTPNIDALAAEGMRFENMWCMPQCTPTRVTLLTGQYPFRHGWTNHFDVPRWGSGAHFDPSLNRSFARVLRDAGYVTAIAGKWQIDDFRVEPGALDEAGFDEWCMWTGGEGGNPSSNERYAEPYVFESGFADGTSRTREGAFGPDVFTDFLIDFMRRHRDRPQLIYYPMVLTHTPLVPTPDEPDAATPLDRHRAMVRYTDQLAGRLVAAIDELGMREDTYIIFTTDNGTTGRITGTRFGQPVRGAKAQMSQAGVCIPFIVSRPGTVPAGAVSEAIADFTDLLPTFAALAGVELDREAEPIIDGHSIAAVLHGERESSSREWILSMGGRPARFRDGRVVPAQNFDDRVISDGRWKLWINEDRQPIRLFDLEQDPGELHNLIHDAAAGEARERLWAVVESLPMRDGAPRYDPNPAQPWDRFERPESAAVGE